MTASYLTQEELQPLPNPEKVLKQVHNDLHIDDWAKQFEALNMIRRINHHHTEVLTSYPNFHGLVNEVGD